MEALIASKIANSIENPVRPVGRVHIIPMSNVEWKICGPRCNKTALYNEVAICSYLPLNMINNDKVKIVGLGGYSRGWIAGYNKTAL